MGRDVGWRPQGGIWMNCFESIKPPCPVTWLLAANPVLVVNLTDSHIYMNYLCFPDNKICYLFFWILNIHCHKNVLICHKNTTSNTLAWSNNLGHKFKSWVYRPTMDLLVSAWLIPASVVSCGPARCSVVDSGVYLTPCVGWTNFLLV